jgi:hypothetical protein
MGRTVAEKPANASPKAAAKTAAKVAEVAPAARLNRPQAVGAIVAPWLKKRLPVTQGNVLHVAQHWRNITPALAAFSQPVALSMGTLKVAVANASVAQQMQFEAPTILEMAQLATGHPCTKLVTLIQPLDKPQRQWQPPFQPDAQGAAVLQTLVQQLTKES